MGELTLNLEPVPRCTCSRFSFRCSDIAAQELDRDLAYLQIADLDQAALASVQEAADARLAANSVDQSQEENADSDDDGEKDPLSLEDGPCYIKNSRGCHAVFGCQWFYKKWLSLTDRSVLRLLTTVVWLLGGNLEVVAWFRNLRRVELGSLAKSYERQQRKKQRCII